MHNKRRLRPIPFSFPSLPYLLLLLSCVCLSCGEQSYTPKPRGYNRIDLPERNYQAIADSLPYHFEHNVLAKVLKDSSWIAEPYWVDLYYPDFDASIQITYKPIWQKEELLKAYLSDAYKLTSKHQVKAYNIEEKIHITEKGNVAVLARLEGEVPSQYQFFITDSTTNFFRGALYFKTATKNDSLAPVIRYLEHDIEHLVESFEWNEQFDLKAKKHLFKKDG